MLAGGQRCFIQQLVLEGGLRVGGDDMVRPPDPYPQDLLVPRDLLARVCEVVTSCGRFHHAILIVVAMILVQPRSGGQANPSYDGSFMSLRPNVHAPVVCLKPHRRMLRGFLSHHTSHLSPCVLCFESRDATRWFARRPFPSCLLQWWKGTSRKPSSSIIASGAFDDTAMSVVSGYLCPACDLAALVDYE